MFNSTREVAENKLIILTIVNEFAIPLTNSQIMDFVMEKDLMNYFFLQQALGELVSSAMLEYSESDENHFYLITEKGKNTLEFFKERLDSDLREYIIDTVSLKRKMLLKEMQVLADYSKKQDNEYIVDLKVVENTITLIDLKLNVVSNKLAKQICEKWKNEGPHLYGDILNLLIEES